jgi:stringent starvation protein A
MAVIASRRSVMTLFSKPADPWSHRTRLVLAEKGINIDIVDVDDGNLPEDLLDLNPYNSVPTLVDRDLVLYDSRVIMEYLDERFPHPPLMPVDPVTRAQFRLAPYIGSRSDWYPLVEADLGGRRPQTRQPRDQSAAGQHSLERQRSSPPSASS